jgi:hypothetical protein
MKELRAVLGLSIAVLAATASMTAAAAADDYIALLDSGREVPGNGSNALGVFTATTGEA